MRQFRVITLDPARADIERLYESILSRARTSDDLLVASKSAESVWAAVSNLEFSAARCRRHPDDPNCRELVIPFGSTGYLALFRLDGDTVYVMAIRHQREDDYR